MEKILTFEVTPPLYTPFYNEWGANAYYTYAPFDRAPFELRCSSTSGSPVVIAGSSFFGLMTDRGGRFIYDGKHTLTAVIPEGQELFFREDCDTRVAWGEYNALLLGGCAPRVNEDFWGGLEYCTWVDQKRVAKLAGADNPWTSLTEEYVYEYMARVKKLGLPKGKLTIDDGWSVRFAPDGKLTYGDWVIDRERFPNMERLVKDMIAEGFIPGLWFAPFTATPNSEIGKKYPDLLGDTFSQNAEAEAVRRLLFFKPDERLREYYRESFEPYIKIGFKKLKLDMSYGKKSDMIALLKMMYEVVKSIDPTVEVEAHIPDIFATRYCDTLRINDVSFDSEGKWRGVTHEHYKVCRGSSPDIILNLDHLGTNSPMPAYEDFIAHVDMLLDFDGGYPCVSLLPDCFGECESADFAKRINGWVAKASAK